MGWQDFTQRSLSYLANDLLLSDLALILNPSQVYLPPMFNGYAALSVSLEVQVVGTITVTITDATGIVPTWSERQTATAALQTLQFVSPYSYTPASALNVTVTSSVNQVHNCPTFINGYGTQINGSNGPGLTRPDGRAYPIGNHSNVVAAAGNIVAAPTAPARVLIAAGSIVVQAAAGAAGISFFQVTIGGTVVNINFVGCPASSAAGLPLQVPEGGILCDPATPVAFASLGAPTFTEGSIIYDLVV